LEAERIKYAIRLPANQVLQERIAYLLTRPVGRPPNHVQRSHALAYNLGNFPRTLAMPEPIKDWSLTSLKDKLIKIGAKVVSHGRYVIFQMAEVAIARQMFEEILRLIAELRPQPPPALA
ncbi:MAG TPA: transposase, partial [Isosphaeraceae bacterium]|nr:transposase [Isosphaeraceae bacterium]